MKQHEISVKTLNVDAKATNMPSTLQPVPKQNSLQHAVAVACKCYKTS